MFKNKIYSYLNRLLCDEAIDVGTDLAQFGEELVEMILLGVAHPFQEFGGDACTEIFQKPLAPFGRPFADVGLQMNEHLRPLVEVVPGRIFKSNEE